MLDTHEIIRQAAAAAKIGDTAATAALQPPPPPAKHLVMTIAIGTAVLDLVTGERGVVIDGKRDNVIISPASNAGG